MWNLPISGYYFDGKNARKYYVTVFLENGVLIVNGDVHFRILLEELTISEEFHHGARKIKLPDGAYIEVVDKIPFADMLTKEGHRNSLPVFLHKYWHTVFLVSCLVGLILFFGSTIGLPWVSKQVVRILPEKVDQSLGKSTLTVLDNTYFDKSTLSLEAQNKIIQQFQKLTLLKQDIPKYNILFRRSKIGPNAFALPSGDIILTDEIVNLIIDNPTSVMGVLAHELGHVHERHAVGRMIEDATLGAVAVALFGDASGLLTIFPAAFVKMKYSRDLEKEADQYAIALFKLNQLDLASLAYVFEKLSEKERTGKKEESSYWDSHPSSKERIQFILDARVK